MDFFRLGNIFNCHIRFFEVSYHIARCKLLHIVKVLIEIQIVNLKTDGDKEIQNKVFVIYEQIVMNMNLVISVM